jgi:glucose/arabinose dehydrogenase
MTAGEMDVRISTSAGSEFMFLRRLRKNLLGGSFGATLRKAHRLPSFRPWCEALEPRVVMDSTPLAMLDPNLQVTTVLNSGLSQPIGIVFLPSEAANSDFLVLEKASGQVKRVINGAIQATPALDLAVNSSSERGLLSMALHPNFPANPSVYIFWTESSTGADSNVVSQVPLLGNRIDRFTWNSAAGTLSFAQNIEQLRARQTDNIEVPGHPGTNNQNENGNHNGGTIAFGPDGKLYVFVGDVGRRGWMQNLPNGPFLTAPQVDDTFGGPAPDDAHLAGVILRLNDDGTAPVDNPFFAAGAAMGGEVGANIQKVFSYGHRNGFGMAFDPLSGDLWETENADDAYSELNRVVPGMNGGWIQLAGPLSRIRDWKTIETTQFGSSLQQVRYPPTRAAFTANLALSRMFMLPGATYVDPQLSWRYEIGPAGMAFVQGNALGAEYDGTLWMGSARSFQQVGGNGGSLYRLRLTPDRLEVDVSADPRLADRVADNLSKFDGTESESMQIGRGFGTTPDIKQGPDGNLYVVSITDGAIYKISRIPAASLVVASTNESATQVSLLLSHNLALPQVKDFAVWTVDLRAGRDTASAGLLAANKSLWPSNQEVAASISSNQNSPSDGKITTLSKQSVLLPREMLADSRLGRVLSPHVVDQVLGDWDEIGFAGPFH